VRRRGELAAPGVGGRGAVVIVALAAGEPGAALVLVGALAGAVGCWALLVGEVRWARLRGRWSATVVTAAAVLACSVGLALEQDRAPGTTVRVTAVPEQAPRAAPTPRVDDGVALTPSLRPLPTPETAARP